MSGMLAPTRREDGIPPNQIEYKTRRLVNDYLQPPKVTMKYELAQLEPILRDSYGVIAYQEQVLRIAQAVAGFTLGQTILDRYQRVLLAPAGVHLGHLGGVECLALVAVAIGLFVE